MYLVGRDCVVCAQVGMGPGSRSKVWDPGPWIQCVLHRGAPKRPKCFKRHLAAESAEASFV
jgi:hypothetical protein